ncbi:hypothetical protein N8I77_000172 [Diaporthe amygdali]|uniref:Heterokaryon incompatibility domain-containing protein n=1 Tax=Phomopsis amygdali TaxID=1214568 RepID=A0AAD9W834_PHOAM|nr:hypothetical protein N8I77_000172 [Diaporthe amygdali]
MAEGLYQYDTLPRDGWFRILKLLPGRFDDPLVCELASTALDAAPSYRAISYVWGDHGKLESITCSGFRRKVTANLFEGLRRMRGTDDVEIAWADAICINQTDQKERSSQVNQMGEIYDRAAEVVVWLGDDDDGVAEIAFNGLRQVNKSIRDGADTAWSSVPSEGHSVEWSSVVSSGPTMILRSTLPAILISSVANAIKNLFQLAWFSRVWILQEVGLATIATACWGSSQIKFHEIGEFIHHAMVHGNLNTVLRQDIKDVIAGSPYYALHNVWYTYDKKNSWVSRSPVLSSRFKWMTEVFKIDIVLVLEASRMMNATDPLDHVFAFLGHPKALQPGTKETLIQANYNTDLKTLHHSLASKIAETSLNFLVQVQNVAEDIQLRNEKPSWIPQWHINNPGAPTAFWEAFDASLVKSTPLTGQMVASVSENTLIASALLFDTIEALTPTMKKPRFEDPKHECAALIEECWDLAAQSHNAYGELSLFAFAATLKCYHKSKTTTDLEYREVVRDLTQYCALRKPGSLESKLGTTASMYSDKQLLELSRTRNYGFYFKTYGTNRRFFTSVGGYFGLGPSCTEQGDVCAILFGADVPFILRPTAIRGRFRLVGQVYMHGAMYGEVVKKWDERGAAYGKTEVCIV